MDLLTVPSHDIWRRHAVQTVGHVGLIIYSKGLHVSLLWRPLRRPNDTSKADWSQMGSARTTHGVMPNPRARQVASEGGSARHPAKVRFSQRFLDVFFCGLGNGESLVWLWERGQKKHARVNRVHVACVHVQFYGVTGSLQLDSLHLRLARSDTAHKEGRLRAE